jgi:hypothetical protein
MILLVAAREPAGPQEYMPMKLRNLKGYFAAAQSPALVQAEIVALLYPRSLRIGTSIFNSILYGIMLTYLMPGWLPARSAPIPPIRRPRWSSSSRRWRCSASPR